MDRILLKKLQKALTLSFKARCGTFVAEHEHTGSGDAYKRTNDPAIKDTAVGKDVAFASRPFTSAEQLVGGGCFTFKSTWPIGMGCNCCDCPQR